MLEHDPYKSLKMLTPGTLINDGGNVCLVIGRQRREPLQRDKIIMIYDQETLKFGCDLPLNDARILA